MDIRIRSGDVGVSFEDRVRIGERQAILDLNQTVEQSGSQEDKQKSKLLVALVEKNRGKILTPEESQVKNSLIEQLIKSILLNKPNSPRIGISAKK